MSSRPHVGARAAMEESTSVPRTKPLRRACCVAALAFLSLAAGPVASQAAEVPGPGWALTATNFPTVLAPEGHGTIEVSLYNVGAVASNGPVTVTDKLPPGITATGEAGALQTPAGDHASIVPGVWNCTGNGGLAGEELVKGATEVTCVNNPVNLPSIQGGGGNPYRHIEVHGEVVLPAIGIPVDAPAGPTSGLNEATVSGDGHTAATSHSVTVGTAQPTFEFTNWDTWFSKADGDFDFQAGSHPYEWTTSFNLATVLRDGSLKNAGGEPRDVVVELPPGVIGNPQAVTQCTRADFSVEACPKSSIVGLVSAYFSGFPIAQFNLFNLVPPPGGPAELAFELNGIGTFIHPTVRTGGDYGLNANVPNIPQREVIASVVTIWGTPAEASHDRWRGFSGAACDEQEVSAEECSGELEPRVLKPFLTLPTSCVAPQPFPISLNTWGSPVFEDADGVSTHDAEGSPTGFTGCNQLPFTPTIEAKPTTNVSDAPTGLNFNVHVPQQALVNEPEGLAQANLKNAVVTLPKGVVVNPASANGLAACSESQVGYLGKNPGLNTDEYTPDAASCPDGAKIGTVEVDSPLISHPLPGAVYLAKPFENPFDSLLGIYIAVDDPVSGVVVKLGGEIKADPQTGQLRTTVAGPELPFEDFHLKFFGGAHAALRTPQTCGSFATSTDMTPWSTPEGADATPSDSFELSQGAGGAPCASSESQLPFKPSFTAGTLAPRAGAYSPFILHLARPDGSQEIKGIDTTLPEGLIGKLAGVTECSDAQIAQAAARNQPGQGASEQASPSCPSSSEVGSVIVGAGAGPDPYYVRGHVYLAGPYKGAPLSLEIVTPAVAGPYDLGAVAVRTALFINPETAQVHAVSDEIPHILAGIPLDVRSIDLELDRNQFTLNPTSCAKKTVLGTSTSTLGQSASLSSPFQVGECKQLGFKPKLAINLKGGTKRNRNPALRAVLTYPTGSYANIASAAVTLPHSEFLDQAHIKTICTRVQFAEGTVPGEKCPAGSIYGFARAQTPLLDQPIEGPVYLRSSSHNLPDLVAALNGQINVTLDGRIDSVHGGLRTTFEAVPDAPVSKFVLEMEGGKKGLLVNSTNLCKRINRATSRLVGQNGMTYDTEPVVTDSCKGKAGKRKDGKGKGKGHKGHH